MAAKSVISANGDTEIGRLIAHTAPGGARRGHGA